MQIFNKIQEVKNQDKPFVAYRTPNDEVLQFMCQSNDDLTVFKSFSSSGFVFAPFNNTEKAYLLKSEKVELEKINYQSIDLVDSDFEENTTEKLKHINLVKKAIRDIEAGNTSKIVISRKEELELTNFDVVSVFKKMLFTYRNAYVYVWYHPKVGLWLGATPETLLKVEEGEFSTMSLAGTQAYTGQEIIEWGKKELEEQQMVSDFIKNNLKNNVEQLQLSDVETVKAGKLLHLRTKIKGVLKQDSDVSKLIDLLHPTPAVCGLSQQNSKAFILENENYNRSFYTGYLGTLNVKKKTDLYVNLRCFNVLDNKATLFVGGGITKDSNPELEWEETVAKTKTIKRVLI